MRTPHDPVKTSWKNLRLLQRADGYAYTTQKEARGFLTGLKAGAPTPKT